MKVLAIEDNRPFLNLLRANLTKRGFTVDGTETLEDGTVLASEGGYDAILLDLALPDGDGKQVVERLRRARDPVPILVLSARGGIGDRVALLDLGADDYLVKPVDFEELAARIHAIARRSAGRSEAPQPGLVFADIVFDPRNRQVIVNGRPTELRPREAALLEALMRRAGEPVHRDALLSSLYSLDEEIGSNALDVHVHHLRRRLAEAGAHATISTMRGLGYALRGTGA
jgi:DNA-binding response OmpR family regulator